MAYTTPPTFVNDTKLTATDLNILSNDIEYLHGLVTGVNLPVGSLRITNDNLTSTNNQWLLRHANRYLHYKLRLVGGTNDSLSIYYDGIRVMYDASTRNAAYTYSGYVDLESPSTWPGYSATAWSSGTTYDEGVILVSSGTYYWSKASSNLNHALSDTTWWRNLGAAGTFPAVGSWYQLYFTTDRDGNMELSADYLLEADGTSL